MSETIFTSCPQSAQEPNQPEIAEKETPTELARRVQNWMRNSRVTVECLAKYINRTHGTLSSALNQPSLQFPSSHGTWDLLRKVLNSETAKKRSLKRTKVIYCKYNVK